ncbi:MAG: winged helix-turn-helix transcriptional regulator [Nitrospirae bacterium]|nr:winged helix-turn-helix transcriptional regulator [Nitrospirota bacterium]
MTLEQKTVLLRVLSHPVRIKILIELTKGVKRVSEIEKFLDISQSNLSQHLSILRTHRVIDCYADGKYRCYFLAEPMIFNLLDVMFSDTASSCFINSD